MSQPIFSSDALSRLQAKICHIGTRCRTGDFNGAPSGFSVYRLGRWPKVHLRTCASHDWVEGLPHHTQDPAVVLRCSSKRLQFGMLCEIVGDGSNASKFLNRLLNINIISTYINITQNTIEI